MTALCTPHQRAKPVRLVGITPAEIIEQRHSIRIGSDGNGVAHSLVYSRPGHRIRVDLTIEWADTGGQDHALSSVIWGTVRLSVETLQRNQHCRIARPVDR